MAYEIVDRGKMFFGSVFDVYQGSFWIGSMVNSSFPDGWIATTPSGKWPITMPFKNKKEAILWLQEQGENIHRRHRAKYEYLRHK